ncbi:diguanylate cyclase [bacterium]|nr:diguanylate cyclase [bacterium]
MKNIAKTRWFVFGTYLLLVLTTLLICFILLRNDITSKNGIISFFKVAENRTFDYRQTIRVEHKKPVPSQDIVILAIDDASLEVLWDKYGEWPIPRNVYADVINYLEKQKPQAIIFDLMFLKSIRSSNSDEVFIEAMNKYPNIYTGINFDNADTDVRIPPELPDRISANLRNESNIEFSDGYKFKNCRPIISGLLNGKVKIGSTNVLRSSDGVLRFVSPFSVYKDKYYPYLGFKAGADCINPNNETMTIDKKGVILIGDTKVYLNKDGEAILNWYGETKTHTHIPFYRVIKEMNGESNYSGFDFKNKIILIGTTAQSMHDTKSVPVQIKDQIYPGVEVHATFLNNMLDNNFIHKSGFLINTIIFVVVIALVGAIAMLSTSTLFAFLSTALFMIGYLFLSYYVMELYNLWIPVVIPIIAIIAAFTLSIIAKYIMKSRDFEYQYKLATIDGLTELYNHRYFQDTLRKQIDIARRYNQPFSLIIADIDFFKKFNDTYGHQAGDAVLRQVAQTLKKNSRTTDYVCRYGGEEMSIILPNTGAEEAMMLATRICKAVSEKPFHLTPVDTADVTISLGVATYPDNAQTPQDIIEWADKGLYYAKEHGRNQVGRY